MDRKMDAKRRILTLLGSSRMDWSHNDAIVDAVWGDDANGGPSDPIGNIKVHIVKLRRLLSKHLIEIETLWGRGYRIPHEDRRYVMENLDEILRTTAKGMFGKPVRCPHCGKDTRSGFSESEKAPPLDTQVSV